MFFVLLILFCLVYPLSIVHGQETVLYFSWDASITVPDVGPTGLVGSTDSPYAEITPGGAAGSNGLSAGLRAGGDAEVTADKANIHLVVPAHEAFNVEGIDISLGYQRDESAGTLVSRGTNFVFATAAGAQVTYSLVNPATAEVTTYTSPVYLLDLNDNLFHNLRFVYDPNSGTAHLSVDGTVVWKPEVTTPGQVLVWEKTEDILIGYDIDGAGFDRAILDNFTLSGIALRPLPVEWTSFAATMVPQGIWLSWETNYERNHRNFAVQRLRPDGDWATLERLPISTQRPSGGRYAYLDPQPLPGVNYYRLAQFDFSGHPTYSSVRSARSPSSAAAPVASPNPTRGWVKVIGHAGSAPIRVHDLRGREMTDRVTPTVLPGGAHQLDLSALPAGWYVVRTSAGAVKVRKR